MTKITLDSALLTQLSQVDTAVEFCDAAGRTVGYFHPVVSQSIKSPFSREDLERRRRREPQISDEEIERRFRQGGGRPLAEILADLEKESMSFTVRYLPNAEQELAALWMDSRKRDSVTKAAHRIDLQLQQDPEQLGESRPQNYRIHFEAPLAILFRVFVSRQLVEGAHVWEFD